MKLKLTLTEKELKELIALQLGLKTDFEYELVKSPFELFMDKLNAGVGYFIDHPHLKIPFIKFLRELTRNTGVVTNEHNVLGLCEAKWAVENWNTFYHFLLTHKRMPEFEGQSSSTLTIK